MVVSTKHEEKKLMAKLVLAIPTLYGDHHTTAVKELLEGLEGVKDVYVSSAFNQVQMSFDKKKLSPEEIETFLAKEGYTTDEPETAYAVSAGERIDRHTAAITGVGDSLSFVQNVSYEGRPLWPCPGFSAQTASDEV
jgi:copper chaperone CopZ